MSRFTTYLICAAAVFLSACGNATVTQIIAPLPPGTDMALSDGVHFTESVDGIVTWDIRSASASYSIASGLLDFKKPSATYFEAGKEAYSASGGEGSYDSKKEILSLSGDVSGRSQTGFSIATDRITYNMKTKIAETDAPVLIKGEGIEMKGVGLTADFASGVFSILDSASIFAEPYKMKHE